MMTEASYLMFTNSVHNEAFLSQSQNSFEDNSISIKSEEDNPEDQINY
jgi:hypothetical protein